MPDSHDRSMPLGSSHPTPTSGVHRSFYEIANTEQPGSEGVHGPAAGAVQIARAPNPLVHPQAARSPAAAPRNVIRPVPNAPRKKALSIDGDASDADADAADDTESEDDTDAEDSIPAAHGGLLSVRRPIGGNARFNGCLKRLQFPPEADHLVGNLATLRLDPAYIDPSLEAFRSSQWTFKVELLLSDKKEDFKRIFIDWESMTRACGVEVGDAVMLRQISAVKDGRVTLNVIIEKGGGVEELAACNREKDGRCKRRAAPVPAANEGVRQVKPKVQKKTPTAVDTPGGAAAPARQPPAPPSVTHPTSASPAARMQELSMCQQIMNRRSVAIKSQAAFQLAFLKADPAVATQALRSLAIANQGSSDNSHVQETVNLLVPFLG